ncbi:MAG: aminopeptidase P N-terminal domain-containing protein [Lachnospiraceae bacterium]
MNLKERRQHVYNKMQPHSALILFSGIEMHVSADEYAPFEANRNFFYLTGLCRERMILMMDKSGSTEKTILFIEEANPTLVRWTGKRVSKEEAKEISQIDQVYFLDSFDSMVNYLMRGGVETLYFDCYRYQMEDLPDYNLAQAQIFASKYTGVQIKDLSPIVAQMRMSKDETEIAKLRQAICITNQALQHVMSRLKPEMKEYQAQAEFEYMIHYLGADGPAFSTIAGSGANGTMMHYNTNHDTCKDGTLLLMDLGAKYQNYCADITRTYPVNGTYSPRQRQVYNIVLKANQAVAASAKPGMRLSELNQICSQVLAEGCIELGLIQDASEINKYYMHGVSHHLGIDVHDVTVGKDEPLEIGAVITDEPGLYIDEWEIGIRIEDDLLITPDGCEVLSADIIRTADEIEAFMAHQKN